MSTQWDAEIEALDIALAQIRSRRDAAEVGTLLHRSRQAEADILNNRLTAYEVAQPVLVELYRELAAETRSNDRYALHAREDAGMWSRVAVVTAIAAGILLLIWTAVGGWWLLLAAFLAGGLCVVATGGAVASHQDQPDTSHSVQLRARIEAVERACRSAASQDDVDHVRALLRPPRAASEVERQRR